MENENERYEIIDQAEELKERVERYQSIAQNIDNKTINSSDNYVPLDNLDYGEELIRIRDIPTQLTDLIQLIETENKDFTLDEARSIIDEANATIDDCKSISE
jgi:hypothetical protein